MGSIMSNENMDIDNKLSDPMFIEELNKLQKHADRLKDQMKFVQNKIDKTFESNDSETQSSVLQLQTELTKLLVEYEETIDRYQTLLGYTNENNVPHNGLHEVFYCANVEITQDNALTGNATKQSEHNTSDTGLDVVKDGKGETARHKTKTPVRTDVELSPVLLDMMDSLLDDNDKVPFNQSGMKHFDQSNIDNCEADFLDSEFSSVIPCSEDNLSINNTLLEVELAEQNRIMAEFDETIAKLKQENKIMLNQINTLHQKTDKSALAKSITQDNLSLSNKTNFDKYVQELDAEIEKTYNIIGKHLIESQTPEKLMNSSPKKQSEMNVQEDVDLTQLEMLNIVLKQRDGIDICDNFSQIVLPPVRNAIESVSEVGEEVCSSRDSVKCDCIESSSVTRNLCKTVENKLLDGKRYKCLEELPKDIQSDSSDMESSQSQITVIDKKQIDHNAQRMKKLYKCGKLNDVLDINKTIEEITRKIMTAREKADRAFEIKKKCPKKCKFN